MKVGVVGPGMVGSTTACSLVMMRAASEVVLVDINEKLARAQAEDIQHATPFVSPARVSAGQYKQLRGAGVVLICCGAAQRPGENRRQLLQRDAAIFYEVVRRVFDAAPDAVLVVASNPVVALTFLTAKIARLPAGRSIGSGTILDTARLRTLVGEHLGVTADSVHANVLGEHGDSEVLVWSSIRVGAFPLATFAEQVGRLITDQVKQQIDESVRRAASHIIDGKGGTNFGIGAALARIVRVIRDDQKAVLSCPCRGRETGRPAMFTFRFRAFLDRKALRSPCNLCSRQCSDCTGGDHDDFGVGLALSAIAAETVFVRFACMIPHNLTPVYRANIRKATIRRQLPVNVDRLWSKLDYGRSLNADCTSAVPMPLTGRCIVGIANERSVA